MKILLSGGTEGTHRAVVDLSGIADGGGREGQGSTPQSAPAFFEGDDGGVHLGGDHRGLEEESWGHMGRAGGDSQRWPSGKRELGGGEILLRKTDGNSKALE